MACETFTREIGGHTFQVTQMPATKAYRMLVKLFALAAPAGAAVLGKAEDLNLKKLLEMDLSSLGDGINALAQNLTPDKAMEILKELLEASTVDGKPLTMPLLDGLMAGKMFALLKLLKFALEVNFSDFFGTSPA